MAEAKQQQAPTAAQLPTTAIQELKHYCSFIAYCAKKVQECLLSPSPADTIGSTSTHSDMAARRDERLVYEDVNSEDEGWCDIGDESLEVPQVNSSSCVMREC